MKKHVARKLIAELESGRWIKAKDQLGYGTKKRCCLGVLQEIAPKKLARRELSAAVPSDDVAEWAGMDIRYVRDWDVLVEVNDETRGWSAVIKKIRELADLPE